MTVETQTIDWRAGEVTTASLAQSVATLQSSAPQILTGTYTVDTLPAASANVGKYARVSDLFGSKVDLVLASSVTVSSVVTYFWQPVRPDFAAKMAVAADATLQALKNPSILLLDGALPALGIFRTMTLSATMAFPGARFRIKNRMSGLGTLRIGNVNLGTPLSIVLGGVQEFVFDMSDGWVQIT